MSDKTSASLEKEDAEKNPAGRTIKPGAEPFETKPGRTPSPWGSEKTSIEEASDDDYSESYADAPDDVSWLPRPDKTSREDGRKLRGSISDTLRRDAIARADAILRKNAEDVHRQRSRNELLPAKLVLVAEKETGGRVGFDESARARARASGPAAQGHRTVRTGDAETVSSAIRVKIPSGSRHSAKSEASLEQYRVTAADLLFSADGRRVSETETKAKPPVEKPAVPGPGLRAISLASGLLGLGIFGAGQVLNAFLAFGEQMLRSFEKGKDEEYNAPSIYEPPEYMFDPHQRTGSAGQEDVRSVVLAVMSVAAVSLLGIGYLKSRMSEKNATTGQKTKDKYWRKLIVDVLGKNTRAAELLSYISDADWQEGIEFLSGQLEGKSTEEIRKSLTAIADLSGNNPDFDRLYFAFYGYWQPVSAKGTAALRKTMLNDLLDGAVPSDGLDAILDHLAPHNIAEEEHRSKEQVAEYTAPAGRTLASLHEAAGEIKKSIRAVAESPDGAWTPSEVARGVQKWIDTPRVHASPKLELSSSHWWFPWVDFVRESGMIGMGLRAAQAYYQTEPMLRAVFQATRAEARAKMFNSVVHRAEALLREANSQSTAEEDVNRTFAKLIEADVTGLTVAAQEYAYYSTEFKAMMLEAAELLSVAAELRPGQSPARPHIGRGMARLKREANAANRDAIVARTRANKLQLKPGYKANIEQTALAVPERKTEQVRIINVEFSESTPDLARFQALMAGDDGRPVMMQWERKIDDALRSQLLSVMETITADESPQADMPKEVRALLEPGTRFFEENGASPVRPHATSSSRSIIANIQTAFSGTARRKDTLRWSPAPRTQFSAGSGVNLGWPFGGGDTTGEEERFIEAQPDVEAQTFMDRMQHHRSGTDEDFDQEAQETAEEQSKNYRWMTAIADFLINPDARRWVVHRLDRGGAYIVTHHWGKLLSAMVSAPIIYEAAPPLYGAVKKQLGDYFWPRDKGGNDDLETESGTKADSAVTEGSTQAGMTNGDTATSPPVVPSVGGTSFAPADNRRIENNSPKPEIWDPDELPQGDQPDDKSKNQSGGNRDNHREMRIPASAFENAAGKLFLIFFTRNNDASWGDSVELSKIYFDRDFSSAQCQQVVANWLSGYFGGVSWVNGGKDLEFSIENGADLQWEVQSTQQFYGYYRWWIDGKRMVGRFEHSWIDLLPDYRVKLTLYCSSQENQWTEERYFSCAGNDCLRGKWQKKIGQILQAEKDNPYQLGVGESDEVNSRVKPIESCDNAYIYADEKSPVVRAEWEIVYEDKSASQQENDQDQGKSSQGMTIVGRINNADFALKDNEAIVLTTTYKNGTYAESLIRPENRGQWQWQSDVAQQVNSENGALTIGELDENAEGDSDREKIKPIDSSFRNVIYTSDANIEEVRFRKVEVTPDDDALDDDFKEENSEALQQQQEAQQLIDEGEAILQQLLQPGQGATEEECIRKLDALFEQREKDAARDVENEDYLYAMLQQTIEEHFESNLSLERSKRSFDEAIIQELRDLFRTEPKKNQGAEEQGSGNVDILLSGESIADVKNVLLLLLPSYLTSRRAGRRKLNALRKRFKEYKTYGKFIVSISNFIILDGLKDVKAKNINTGMMVDELLRNNKNYILPAWKNDVKNEAKDQTADRDRNDNKPNEPALLKISEDEKRLIKDENFKYEDQTKVTELLWELSKTLYSELGHDKTTSSRVKRQKAATMLEKIFGEHEGMSDHEKRLIKKAAMKVFREAMKFSMNVKWSGSSPEAINAAFTRIRSAMKDPNASRSIFLDAESYAATAVINAMKTKGNAYKRMMLSIEFFDGRIKNLPDKTNRKAVYSAGKKMLYTYWLGNQKKYDETRAETTMSLAFNLPAGVNFLKRKGILKDTVVLAGRSSVFSAPLSSSQSGAITHIELPDLQDGDSTGEDRRAMSFARFFKAGYGVSSSLQKDEKDGRQKLTFSFSKDASGKDVFIVHGDNQALQKAKNDVEEERIFQFYGPQNVDRLLSEDEKNIIRRYVSKIETEQKMSFLDYIGYYQFLLEGHLKAEDFRKRPGYHLGQIFRSSNTNNANRASNAAREIIKELGWLDNQPAIPLREQIIWTAILISLENQPDVYLAQREIWGKDYKTIREQFESFLLARRHGPDAEPAKLADKNAAALASALLQQQFLPEALVADIPPHLVYGSLPWVLFRTGVDMLEEVEPGSSKYMSYDEIMKYVSEALNSEEEDIRTYAFRKILPNVLKWAAVNHIVPEKAPEKYTEDDISVALSSFDTWNDKTVEAVKNLSSPPPQMKEYFDHYDVEVAFIKVAGLGWRKAPDASKEAGNKSADGGDDNSAIAAGTKLYETKRKDRLTKKTDSRTPLAETYPAPIFSPYLRPVYRPEEFETAFSAWVSEYKKSYRSMIALLISKLPLEDRIAIEYGKIDLLFFRQEPDYSLRPGKLARDIRSKTGYYGFLIKAEHNGETSCYEVFPGAMLIRRRPDLARTNMSVGGIKKFVKLRDAGGKFHTSLQLTGEEIAIDFDAYQQGLPPKEGRKSTVIVDRVGNVDEIAGDKDENAVPVTLQSERTQAIANAIADKHSIDRESLHESASQDPDRTPVIDKAMDIGKSLVPLWTAIGDIQEGDVRAGAMGTILDLSGFVAVPVKIAAGARQAINMIRQVGIRAALPLLRPFAKSVFISVLDGFNPIPPAGLLMQPAKWTAAAVKRASRGLAGLVTKRKGMASQFRLVDGAHFQVIDPSKYTLTPGDQLKTIDGVDNVVVRNVGSETAPKYYRIHPDTGLPYGAPYKQFADNPGLVRQPDLQGYEARLSPADEDRLVARPQDPRLFDSVDGLTQYVEIEGKKYETYTRTLSDGTLERYVKHPTRSGNSYQIRKLPSGQWEVLPRGGSGGMHESGQWPDNPGNLLSNTFAHQLDEYELSPIESLFLKQYKDILDPNYEVIYRDVLHKKVVLADVDASGREMTTVEDFDEMVSQIRGKKNRLDRDSVAAHLDAPVNVIRPQTSTLHHSLEAPGGDIAVQENLIDRIFQSSRGMIIGEFHDNVRARKLIMSNMLSLRNNNVKFLYVEYLVKEKQGELITHFYETGTMSTELQRQLDGIDNAAKVPRNSPYSLENILITSRNNGIRVVPLELAVTQPTPMDRHPISRHHIQPNRLRQFNYATTLGVLENQRLPANANANWVLLSGSAHIGNAGEPGSSADTIFGLGHLLQATTVRVRPMTDPLWGNLAFNQQVVYVRSPTNEILYQEGDVVM